MRTAQVVTCMVPIAVLFVAAVGKILDLSHFENTVAAMDAIPKLFRVVALYLLPLLEALPLGAFIGGRSRLAATTALVLLVAVSMAFAWQWAEGQPPTCSCLGLWARYVSMESGIKQVLQRNALLATLCVCHLMLTRSRNA